MEESAAFIKKHKSQSCSTLTFLPFEIFIAYFVLPWRGLTHCGYRLNVFPVRLPALRQHPEDISLLVRHFVDFHAKRMNKPLERVPNEAMKIITSYAWPGNVRELQNFIERAVILSPSKILFPPLTELKLAANNPDA
jgi:transcriptional regulator with AAA-type ATPase domain